MELHQLRYTLAVLDAGSFTAAAAAMRVSQSGVSAQIAKLERELGVTILDRSTRRVTTTAAGERLAPMMRAALVAVDAVGDTASQVRGLVTGTLRVGTVGGLTWQPVFDALADMHADHPGLDITVREDVSSVLLDQLRHGEIDVAVVGWANDPPTDLRSITVFDEAICVAVAPDNPWARRDKVSPDDLAETDLVALSRGTGARAALDALLSSRGSDHRPRWEVATPAMAVRLAARGLGAAVLSETTLAATTTPGVTHVVAIPIDDPRARSCLGIAWRDESAPATTALLERLASTRDGSGRH